MLLHDTAEIAARRITRDGFMVATARTARTGIQLYRGSEMGRADMETVRVYRSPEEVFAKDSMASFAHRPVTIDHPTEMVDASNWKKYSRGATGDEVAKDGEFVRVPFALMDADAIRDIEGGKRELSWGYWSDVEFVSGKTPQGESYDAIQKNIRGNHLAVVDTARGGPHLRIGDQRDAEMQDRLIALLEKEKPMALKTVTIDGLTIETTDQGAQAIDKLQRALTDAQKAKTDAEAKATADAAAAKSTLDKKDGEIDGLKKHLADAAMTPAKLDAAVKARSLVIDAAKKIGGDKIAVDGKTDGEIRRQAVALKLGDDAVKDRSDDYVSVAFDTLVKTGGGSMAHYDPARDALNSGVVTQDAAKARSDAYTKMQDDMRNAWKNPSVKAA